ncbi:MAG: hypothetical protein A2275_11915 [Bacteroidetes bacterium RIFOXYA12_FULL_35_11]|nr:MAG: hypothetical protein A2X01_21075 [Bacteroidetes bacterium GWF2_35_48]OFY81560.1 MAG: hypothetical protein A2275_11915 [Bacteroidetes bacterium RIFOXYA12_FULL_35_11]OFY94412.1 MAG: hypothetical protein A2491_00360 [Bacteroidetes bacterium RIFOXYC12_FULL_35_7]OFY96258.1 MAG: hypothetical protein A2309_05880 [Bacteroidetes bacterium RIFOXYB2_FULL_35_7]HBX50441.1 hypothetical protein [Bacteroidales bacterium]
MKKKNLIQTAVMVLFVAAFLFTGCKKNKEETPDPTSLSQLSKDENEIQSNTDDALNDANDMLSGGTAKSVEWLPCNATVSTPDTISNNVVWTITYNGLNCSGKRNRVGVVKVAKPVNQLWRNQGATITIEFINLKITRVLTGKSITLNGTKTFVNESGGIIRELISGSAAVVHTVTGSLTILFDDNSTRQWNVSRKKTCTGVAASGQLEVSIEGTGSANGMTQLVTWGTNRNGEQFYTQITTPLVLKQACYWEPFSGVKKHSIPADGKSATLTFGLDSSGNIVSGSNCATHYRIDWEKNGNTGTILLAL